MVTEKIHISYAVTAGDVAADGCPLCAFKNKAEPQKHTLSEIVSRKDASDFSPGRKAGACRRRVPAKFLFLCALRVFAGNSHF